MHESKQYDILQSVCLCYSFLLNKRAWRAVCFVDPAAKSCLREGFGAFDIHGHMRE